MELYNSCPLTLDQLTETELASYKIYRTVHGFSEAETLKSIAALREVIARLTLIELKRGKKWPN